MRVIRRSASITELLQAARFFRAPARASLAASAGVVLLSLSCGCDVRSFALQDEEETADPSGPTSATFQLAPSAPGSAKPAPPAADNVLAATAVDATASAAQAAASAASVSPRSASVPPAADSFAAVSPGKPSPTCVNGWSTPERGTALRGAPLDMMRVRPGERFIIEEMRYFVGPEDADVLGARGDVERWYVKASTEAEPRRRQRWLVRRAKIGSGIDAIAAFESTGYGPGIWRRPDASDPSWADPFERPCQGTKPGDKCTGLPREVLGCLSGT
jgi:hypothetical protein